MLNYGYKYIQDLRQICEKKKLKITKKIDIRDSFDLESSKGQNRKKNNELIILIPSNEEKREIFRLNLIGKKIEKGIQSLPQTEIHISLQPGHVNLRYFNL